MQKLDEQHYETALKGVSIPSCPAILTELISELRKPSTNGKLVAQLIGRDVGLAAMVIKAANSPLFGSKRQIGSIAEAIKLLGFSALTNLVYEGLLRSVTSSRDASLERFWDSSAHTAAISAELASVLGGVSRDTAHTFGLFHDCGIPMLVERFPDYKQVLNTANESMDRKFTDIEDEALSTNHAAIGSILARSWGLPVTVSNAILCHHDYEVLYDAQGLENESRSLIAINALAGYIAGQYLRSNRDQEWGKAAAGVSSYFGISASELDDIAEDLLYRLDKQKNDR